MPTKTIEFPTARHLNLLYCNNNDNISRTEALFNVKIVTRDNWIEVEGSEPNIQKTSELFELLDLARNQGLNIKNSDFEHILHAVNQNQTEEFRSTFTSPLIIKVKGKSIIPKTVNQKRYLQYIEKNDIVLCIGPAGTGKTYLAMAAAIQALLNKQVDKIILTRPAVEAGEALGFLPGDLREKILPYLRPLYDAMYDILGVEETTHLLEKDIIEIAPLAYMRGRTLSNAFIILDEAQNTTHEQILMCITRLGDRSRIIITGDITQIDLPKTKPSGLKIAIQALADIEGIKTFSFESKDVIRHPLVRKIIDAYAQFLSLNEKK